MYQMVTASAEVPPRSTRSHGNAVKYTRNWKNHKISLNLELNAASELILEDKKHLDNNPIPITKNEIIDLLKEINLNGQ